MYPAARDDLITVDVDDDLVLYDEARHRAHALNRAAAAVWRRCDGATDVPALAEALHREVGLPADEAVVWLALDRLERAKVLRSRVPRPAAARGTTRRAVLARLGAAGGLALVLPTVLSIAAPTPADAASGAGAGGGCGQQGDPCASSAGCCPGMVCKDFGFGSVCCPDGEICF